MPIGSASIKRASGAINKTGEKNKKSSFSSIRTLVDLEISKIKFDKITSNLDDLKKSIKKYGVLNPVSVLKDGNDFILISGKSRLTVASELNLETIPAIVISVEGVGVSAAKKDLYLKKSPSVIEEMTITSDIHEEKFNVIKGIGTDLPDYLL